MPHIKISMYPGRGKDIKKALAEKMQAALSEELNIPKEAVTVSIEDVDKENWDDEIKKIPEETIFIKN